MPLRQKNAQLAPRGCGLLFTQHQGVEYLMNLPGLITGVTQTFRLLYAPAISQHSYGLSTLDSSQAIGDPQQKWGAKTKR